MSDFFNRDNAYNRFMTKAFDLCVLNLMFFITCLPYFTIGASLTAVYRVMLKMAEDKDSSIVKTYFSEFKSNFKKSTLLFIIPGVALLLMLFDLLFWSGIESSIRTIGYTSSIVMLILWACWMFWLFPLTAQFENTNRAAMKNAVKFAVSFLPVTLIMSVAGMAYCAVLLFNSMLWPFIPVFALSLMLYPQTLYVNRVFKKYRAEHKEVYADASGDI